LVTLNSNTERYAICYCCLVASEFGACPDFSDRFKLEYSEVRGAHSEVHCATAPTPARRFESTKHHELGFRALLTEGDAWVLFHRELLDLMGKAFAQTRRSPRAACSR
jgi:hypothetical protein